MRKFIFAENQNYNIILAPVDFTCKGSTGGQARFASCLLPLKKARTDEHQTSSGLGW